MAYENQTIKVLTENEQFFCFELESGAPVIFDYKYFDREISILPDFSFSLTEKVNEKKKVGSIDAMRKELCKIIAYLLPSLQGLIINTPDWEAELNKNANDLKLITNQIIFDILHDEYLKNSPSITLNEYCTKYIPYDWDDSIYESLKDKISLDLYNKCFNAVLSEYTKVNFESISMAKKIRTEASLSDLAHLSDEEPELYLAACIGFIKEELDKKKDATFHAMVKQMELEAEIMERPALKEEVRQLGVDPDSRSKYYNKRNEKGKRDIKKPKRIWDNLYFNGCPNFITSKQYRRNWVKDSNYSYAKFIDDYNNYDKFVEAILPNSNDESIVYIQKCMHFYDLEIYKKLDFVYKLALKMESERVADINREHPLVNRFHPIVLVPYVDDNKLQFYEKPKYYRPIIFMEEKWMEQFPMDDQNLFCKWHYSHLLRAKTYELFKYHYEFLSNDYDSIAEFLHTDYNIKEYHVKDKNGIIKVRRNSMRIGFVSLMY